MAEFPAAKVLPELEQLAADKDAMVRKAAAWALGRLGSADAIPVLDGLVDDADYDIAREAVFSLSEIGGNKTLEILKRRTAHVPARLPAELFEALDRVAHEANTELR